MELALAATVRNRLQNGLCIAALSAGNSRNGNPRDEEWNFVLRCGKKRSNPFKFFGMRRSDDRAQVAVVPFENLACDLEKCGFAVYWHILKVRCALVACTEKQIDAASRRML